MNLGNFSVSLNVKCIKESKEFYEKIGFKSVFGNIEEKWLIMQNGSTKIGLFEGMLDKNIMTFNPKWDQNGTLDDSLDDIRDIYKTLENEEIEFTSKINDNESGANNFSIIDPDGNIIMFDQHV